MISSAGPYISLIVRRKKKERESEQDEKACSTNVHEDESKIVDPKARWKLGKESKLKFKKNPQAFIALRGGILNHKVVVGMPIKSGTVLKQNQSQRGNKGNRPLKRRTDRTR